VVDPRETDPFDAYGVRRGHLRSAQGLFDLALGSMRAARRLPGDSWARLMRLAERTGQVPQGPVVFECVGVPGMIDALVGQAPLRSRVIVVGVCMEPDTIRPAVAIGKEIDLRFVFGYDPAEFHQTLQWLASGRVDPTPLVTGTVGLDGVAGAFEDLAAADRHAKILIRP
jgi:threonine dehydrogenase-like Zn-dependent dehydrogenase